MLDIVRLLRNTGHNNGRHTRNTVTKELRGKPYVFEKDKEPALYAWLPFIEIAREIKNMFVDIANSDKFEQSTIVDPNAQAIGEFQERLFMEGSDHTSSH